MIPENYGEIAIFHTEDGAAKVQIQAVVKDETIWLTQKAMGELFGCSTDNIGLHLKNIFRSGELDELSVTEKNSATAADGKNYLTKFYNLDAIIAVGYRVNSKRATQFRQWATTILKAYLVKGFALDDERFKQGQSLTHFRELLERIRAIRISEKVFYQQIKDIYRLSEDYDNRAQITIDFFAEVQNKLLWAVSGQTAAELVYYRANAQLPQMGLTSTQIQGIVRKSDIEIGKNYLNREELEQLKLIVEQYLAFAEAQAKAHRPMYMADWQKALGLILQMNGRELLSNSGKISHELAKQKANTEYNTYKKIQKQQQKLESIRELSEDLERLQNKRD